MLEGAKQQLLALPRPVHLWMRWLNIVFLFGLFFVDSQDGAKWGLIAYFTAFPIGVLVFWRQRDMRLTGLAHIICWTPVLVCLPTEAAMSSDFRLLTPYGVWIVLLCATVAVSVIFDIRAVVAALRRRTAT